MKKRGWAYILLKIILTIIGVPVVLIGLLIVSLYVPSVQNAVVEKACKEISERSGYDVEIGSIRFSFPLKMKATDFGMSKNDTLYFQGKRFDANISLIPLFAGKVEVNYVSFENLEVNTRDILPDMCVDGNVGYMRVVARDADLTKAIADIRQLHITDTNLNIELSGTSDSEESEPLQWIINMRNGRISNSNITITLPQDTLKAGFYIGKLQLDKGEIDLASTGIAIKRIALSNSCVSYDKGHDTPLQAPLDHIRLNDINFCADDLRYSSYNEIRANITQLVMEQPGGIAITKATARIASDKETLMLSNFEIASRNGSYIQGGITVPQQALNAKEGGFLSTLYAGINKRDLVKLVTPQMYDNLHYFDEQLMNAEIALSGNIQEISIDTIALDFPGVGAMNANGSVELKTKNINAHVAFSGELDDIKNFIGGENHNNSIDGRTLAKGNIFYDSHRIDADAIIRNAMGEVDITASYNIADTAYNAQMNIPEFALSGFLPDIPLHSLKMSAKAEGRGIDLFSNGTEYNVDIAIDTLYYASNRLHAINARASQANSISSIEIDGCDKNLLFGIDATTVLAPTGIDNRTAIELVNADLREIGVVDSMLKVSTSIDIAATSDFKESHSLKISGNEVNIITGQNRFTPENLSLDFSTTPEKTSICIMNGDLDVDGEMNCGYNKLFAAIEEIGTMHKNMLNGKNSLYHINEYEKVLPRIALRFVCGEKNILHNFLAFSGIETKEVTIDADISQRRGLNIRGNVNGFSTGSITLDSIKFITRQYKEKLNYIIGASDLAVTSAENENSYNALIHGSILCDTITTNLILRDNVKDIDSKAGFTTVLSPGNMHLHFNPEVLMLGAPFAFNRDNYIKIGKAMSVDADVTFTGSNDNGFHLYTTPDDKATYNVNLDFFNIHIAELVKILPTVPDVSGTFFANLNYKQEGNGNIFTCNANVEELTYNGDLIGNEKVELVYSPKTDEVHDISCSISHNDTQVAYVRSDYQRGAFNGNILLTRLPLDITQAFIDKEGVIMNGYLNSKVDFSGTLSDMNSYGYLHFDSVYAYSPMLGAMLHPAEDLIMIENNKINLQRFHIYDKANTPFVINGTVDISNLLNPYLGLRLNASNYEIINTPQSAGKMVYGKMFVDLRSVIRGRLDNIKMLGDLTVLSSSNFAYVIPETAFDSNKELDGLVEFVNFNDTTAVKQQEEPNIDLGDITANLNVIIKEGAKLSLDLDSSRENYVSIEGYGNLNATYDNKNGFNVTGIYNLNGGQLKLTLPIIPLKTFYIQEGGRLTWTGDLFNPTLDVTALESTTASVEMDDNSIQSVVFNAGVTVSNSVNDLGIDFTMSAPDNSVIQNQLNGLDKETMNRYAVAMIITGTYLGSRQGVTATNALSSFLDAKINEISGTAIKNFDVNFGINDALNAETGNTYTSYSFSFSKRFFNDRITIVIGGEVNSGDRPDKTAGNNTFINNVSLEWKLNEEGNRYIRVFYDKNYQSLLEGEITETGVGYVYKRKLNTLKELFTFKRKNKKTKENDTEKKRAKQ